VRALAEAEGNSAVVDLCPIEEEISQLDAEKQKCSCRNGSG